MSVPDVAVIAAAGMGTRIGLGMPKCMIEIAGTTLLTHLIESLRAHVQTIYVAVGYREEMVIEYCSRYHRDVILVRNPSYRETNTAVSAANCVRHVQGKVIYLDGDLLIEPASLSAFLHAAARHPILVGVTEPQSQNAVYAMTETGPDGLRLRGFSRTESSPYEWANVVSGPADLLANAPGYVYERLEEFLPLPALALNLAEVDTAQDLELAKRFAEQIGLAGARHAGMPRL